MTKKVLISLEELRVICCEYKKDYEHYSPEAAENNLELWFLGNEVIDEKNTD